MKQMSKYHDVITSQISMFHQPGMRAQSYPPITFSYSYLGEDNSLIGRDMLEVYMPNSLVSISASL